MTKHTPQARLSVDIGGTFTDIAIQTPDGIETAKTLTTHDDPVRGVLEGAEIVLRDTGLCSGDIASVIHGTTLATNALIERRGAKVAVITTEGFRDILEIGYERRYDQYDINIKAQDLIVSRDLVFTVRERIAVSGAVLTPLDESTVLEALRGAQAAGAQSLAICLLHSYKTPDHERRVRDIVARHAPDMSVSLSSDVSPEIREFDRLCTTICNAYIKPLMAGYLSDLADMLREKGFDCPLFVITSGGGMTTLETAMAYPIRLVESGPSGGAIMAAKIAGEQGLDRVVSFDMGGTTAKISLIEDHTPKTSRTFEIDRAERFCKGSGIPVRIPVIEMIEIGAGGGSIARIDGMGRLRVGPHSASSDPGPACYGRGGRDATVTDADMAIGLIDPAGFAEGRLALQPERSQQAIRDSIGAALGLSAADGAMGIAQTVDEAMANAARMHAVEQGRDLSSCTMVAFGGNGPLHATRIAEKTGIARIIIPPNPSVGSAVGFLFAPVAYEIVRSFPVQSEGFPFAQIAGLLQSLEEEATGVVAAGAGGAQIHLRRSVYMRYVGQGQEIEVPLAPGAVTPDTLGPLLDRFEADYKAQFGRIVPGMSVEFINWSVVAQTRVAPPAPVARARLRQPATAQGSRALDFGSQGARADVPVYQRAQLVAGDTLSGPALIVEPQTTTYVSDAFDAEVDDGGNLILTRVGGQVATPTQGTSQIDLQIMWDRLLAIVEEQGQVLMRTAFSPIVRECGDISAGIFDTDGQMLAQAVTGTPGHINTMAATVGLMLPHLDADAMRPGDVFATNDPWIGAGHLNDIALIAPIFHDGALVGYSACTSHVYDLGGRGMGPDGTDVFDEGLFIPICKLVDQGVVNQLVIDFIKANSRSPIANEGDCYALIACCDVAAERLSAMMAEFGMSDLDALGAHILEASRRATVAAIHALPNGTYHNALMIDGYDFEIRMCAAVTIKDARIEVDLTGTSGHSALGINCPINYTAAYGVFALRCLIGGEVPNNAASLAPFVFTAPKDCILNAQFPAPVAMRHATGQMVADLIFGAVHKAVPGLAPADGASCLWDLPIRSPASAGLPGSSQSVYATEFTHSGGTGARPGLDGLSATAFPSGVFGTQSEIAEITAPVRYLRRELRTDSGGAGQYRGGLGQVIEMESSENADILLLAGVERTKYAAQGRDGGHAGTLGDLSLSTGAVLRCKGEQVIPAGTRLIWNAPGGGGYGNPHVRPRAQVAADVRLGLVSARVARGVYGVVLHADGTVDAVETRACRGHDD